MITSFIEYFEGHPAASMGEMLALVERRLPRTFKQDIALDIREFLDTGVFGEEVTLNGVKLRAVVIWESGERQKPDLALKHEGHYVHPKLHNQPIHGELCTVYFRAAEYLSAKERLPKTQEAVYLNGSRYYVKTMAEEYGVAEIELEADRQPKALEGTRLPRLPGLYE